MSLDADQLFALLPAVYRTRDADKGGPLQALYSVMAAQSAVVEQNIEQLYDDAFIETCASWVVPYIGDLIGYNSIYQIDSGVLNSRAEVANTIGYRRRKGTLIALEQLSMDVSGRTCKVVEEFKRLIVTESMRHVRPQHQAFADLRRVSALDRLGTAFDPVNRTIDVRRIAARLRTPADPDPVPLDIALHGPGRFNIPDVAIWLWRWRRSLQVTGAPAYPLDHGSFMFSPLGQNIPLFCNPPKRLSFSRPTTILDAPQPIYRHEFSRRITDFYGVNQSLLLIADGAQIDASQICCANLADRPGGARCEVPSGYIAIDPELGRIQFAADVPTPRSLFLNYSYGFPAEIAGGPYDRSTFLSPLNAAQVQFFAFVGSLEFPSLEAAVAQWNEQLPGSSGIIVLPNFQRYTIDVTGINAIQIRSGSSLAIVAAEPIPSGGVRDVAWSNSCVTLVGNIDVVGAPADAPPASAGSLLMSGLWISGRVLVAGEGLAIEIDDSTLVPGLTLARDGAPIYPGEPSIVVRANGATLTLNRAISGPIAADASGATRICSSIVDATLPCCVAYAAADLASAGADLHVEDSTIIGKVRTRTMRLASNTIFHARLGRHDPWDAAIWSSRRQVGCVRFCSLPFDSITPRRYECLPKDAGSQSAFEPKFITLRYGHPSYALLSGDVPLALWRGADDGSQIGIYHQIQETEAVSNVQLRASEYLPATLEYGIFLIPSRSLPEPAPAPPIYGLRRGGACDEEFEYLGIGIGLL